MRLECHRLPRQELQLARFLANPELLGNLATDWRPAHQLAFSFGAASPYRIAASSAPMFISFRALNRMQYPVTLALPSFSPYVLVKYFLSLRPSNWRPSSIVKHRWEALIDCPRSALLGSPGNVYVPKTNYANCSVNRRSISNDSTENKNIGGWRRPSGNRAD